MKRPSVLATVGRVAPWQSASRAGAGLLPILVAAWFGRSAATDLYALFAAIFTLAGSLIFACFKDSALVPVLMDLERRRPEEVPRLVGAVGGYALMAATALAVLMGAALVVLAAERARQVANGAKPIVRCNNKPAVTALREIAQVHKGDFRLTPSQNLTISGVATNEKPVIDAVLKEYELDQENEQSGLRLNALSCVALPTCGLALSESERVLPELLGRLESVLDEVGLHRNSISIRITGCPNGCARPYLGEIGFVGKGPNKFALYLGAQYEGTRLNRLFAQTVTLEQGIELLTPVIQRYAKERHEGENFGDYCDRAILPKDATFHSVGTPLAKA